MTSHLVGLVGFAGSGKDSVANRLVDFHRFRRLAFGDKIKDFTLAMNPVMAIDVESRDFYGLPNRIRLQLLVKRLGWDFAKRIPVVRELLQEVGEAARETLGDYVWIDAAMSGRHSGNTVFSDVRKANEAKEIENRGGVLIRISRKGVGPVNGHATEAELVDWPVTSTVFNNGTLEQLSDQVDGAVAFLNGRYASDVT